MIKEENYIVSKKNILVITQYDLTLIEQKLICWLACNVQIKDKEFKKYDLRIKDFIEGLGTNNQMKYTTLPEVAKNLMRKVFEIQEGKTTHIISWLSCATYTKGSGLITLEFSPTLKDYLLNLKDYYLTYKLWNVLKLKNRYSIKMYEYLKSKQFEFENHKTLEINLVDLKKYINCTEKSYSIFNNFNNKVLKPIQKEMEILTDLRFTYKPIKQGHKITGLKITMHKNKIPERSAGNELYDQLSLDENELYQKAADKKIAAEQKAAQEEQGEDEVKEDPVEDEVKGIPGLDEFRASI